MLQKLKTIALTISALALLGAAAPASAVASTARSDIQSGVKTAAGGADTTSAGKSVGDTISTVINIFSLIIGIIAVFMIIIGGLNYITSGGNEQKVSTAKSTIIYAVIGLVIVAFAQLIVRFTVNAVDGGKGVTGPAGKVNTPSDNADSSGNSGGNIDIPRKQTPL